MTGREKTDILFTVVKDYRSSVKEAVKRLKGSDIFCYGWMIIFACTGEKLEFGLNDGVYITVIILMFFGALISRMYPCRLEKTLLLCPLTREEKMQYVKTGYLLKVFLPLLIYILAGIAWMILKAASPFYLLIVGIWMFFFLSCANIYSAPEPGGAFFHEKSGAFEYEAWHVANALLGVAEMFGVFYLPEAAYMDVSDYCFVILVTALHGLLAFGMRKRFYLRLMEGAVQYENND